MRRLAALLPLLAACATDPVYDAPSRPVIPPASAPLYERLGGRELVDPLAAWLLAQASLDPRLTTRLRGLALDERRPALVAQLCSFAEGPCEAPPPPPADPPTLAELEALRELFEQALERFHLGARERFELEPALPGVAAIVLSR